MIFSGSSKNIRTILIHLVETCCTFSLVKVRLSGGRPGPTEVAASSTASCAMSFRILSVSGSANKMKIQVITARLLHVSSEL